MLNGSSPTVHGWRTHAPTPAPTLTRVLVLVLVPVRAHVPELELERRRRPSKPERRRLSSTDLHQGADHLGQPASRPVVEVRHVLHRERHVEAGDCLTRGTERRGVTLSTIAAYHRRGLSDVEWD